MFVSHAINLCCFAIKVNLFEKKNAFKYSAQGYVLFFEEKVIWPLATNDFQQMIHFDS